MHVTQYPAGQKHPAAKREKHVIRQINPAAPPIIHKKTSTMIAADIATILPVSALQ
jgi:hypothetical protein